MGGLQFGKRNSRVVLLFATLLCTVGGCNHDGTSTQAAAIPRAQIHYSGESTKTNGWPNLFGPSYDSTSPETGLNLQWPAEGPRELWRRPLGEGYSVPVALGKQLVVMYRIDDTERVECVNSASGESRWQFDYPTTYRCTTAYSNGPYSTPAIAEGRVYSFGAQGQLHCIDLETADVIWTRMLLDEFQVKPNLYAPACSPCVVDGRVILNVGGTNAGIVGLDASTGDTVWSATNDTASYASPVAATIHGRRFVFLNTQEHFTAIDPASGKVWWQIPFQAKNHEMVTASSPVVHGDLVAASAYQVGAMCVRVMPDGGYVELWREGPRTLSNQFNNMVCRDGFLYSFTALDRSLRCLNLANGEIVWKWPSDFGRGAMSVAVGDHLILIGELGHLGVIQVKPEAADLKFLSKGPILAKPCFTQPALHEGRLYLRNEKELVCLDLRKGE